MASAIPADAVSFVATSSGTVDFVFATGRPSWVTPAQAVSLGNLVDGQIVPYFAQDDPYAPTQREWGLGTYVNASLTVQRTTVQGGVSAGVATGAGTKVSFGRAPIVSFGPISTNVVTGTMVPGTSSVVIGGTSASATLTLESTSGAGTGDAIFFRTGSQVEAGRVDTSQNVNFGNQVGNIGDVNGVTPRLQVSGLAASVDFRRYSADANPPTISCFKSRGATVLTNTVLQTNDAVMQLIGGGLDANASPVTRPAAYIRFDVDSAPTTSAVPGRIVCVTANSAGVAVESIRADSSQNVNIGNQTGGFNNVLGNAAQLQVSATHDVLDLRCFSTTAATGPNITTLRSHNATLNTSTAVVSGDVLLSLLAGGYDATGTPVARQAGQIVFEADGTPTAGSVLGRVRVLTTATGNTTPTEAARVDTSQNVNVGNQGALIADVLGNSPKLQISNTGDAIDLRRYTADANGPSITSAKSHNATLGTNTVVSSGDALLNILGGGYDNTGTPVIRGAAQILFEADAAATVGSVPGRVRVLTTPSGSTTLTEAFRIDANQNVIVSTAALATNATNGFLYVDTCAGTPTGTPTAYTGRAPVVYDTTNNILWIYTGSAWAPCTLGTAYTSYTATLTSQSGTVTGATTTSTCYYWKNGRTLHLHGQIVLTTIGSGSPSGFVQVGLPLSLQTTGGGHSGVGFNLNSNKAVSGASAGVTNIGFLHDDGTALWVAGASFYFSAVLETTT
jgi:hypothetical protein